MLRVFFGRHKSASTWARNIIHDAAHVLGLKITTIHVPKQYEAYGSVGDMVRAEKPDILIMTRAFQHEVDTLPEFRGVHLIRDPRDIVVSGYFSHRNSHPEVFGGVAWPELVEFRKLLKTLDKDEGMAAEIEFSSAFLEPMSTWDYHQPGVLELKMEDLIIDQSKLWSLIFTHLEMLAPEGQGDGRRDMAKVRWNLASRYGKPRAAALLRKVLPPRRIDRLPHAYIDDVLERFSFTSLSKSSRKPGEVDENSHYRKGVAGDWQNHLTPRHLEIFRERYGDIVERLGYQ